LLNVAATFGALCLVTFLACLAFGLRPAIVISGSMEPGYPVGSLTFSRLVPVAEIRPGDVVTLERNDGNGLVTHRVMEIHPGPPRELVLKGDANTEPDPVPYRVQEAGLVLAVIPWVGYLVQAIQSNFFLAIAILIAITALATIPIRSKK
jgi:signal peptidase